MMNTTTKNFRKKLTKPNRRIKRCKEHLYEPIDVWYDCPKCCERGFPFEHFICPVKCPITKPYKQTPNPMV